METTQEKIIKQQTSQSATIRVEETSKPKTRRGYGKKTRLQKLRELDGKEEDQQDQQDGHEEGEEERLVEIDRTNDKSAIEAATEENTRETDESAAQHECLMCPDFAVCRGGRPPMTQAGYWRVPWREEIIFQEKTDSPTSETSAVKAVRLKVDIYPFFLG